MTVGQMHVGGAKTLDRNSKQIATQRRSFLNHWSEECQNHSQRQLRTEHKGHIPCHRIEIKISDPARNRTRAAGLVGREYTDHTTATDAITFNKL